jgi:RNA polymerase sigma factor (sigma-70 family)
VKGYTDIEIIECLRKRESYVVRYLQERYFPMIRLMITQLGGSSEDAKDMFQEGLMIMLEKIDDNKFFLTCKFKTFLYSVCENLWKSVIEKRQAAANYFLRRVEDEDRKDITEIMDNSLCKEIFNNAFETLDPVGQKILKLYWEEMSPKEIADKLGYTYGYIRKKKCEAQAELVAKVRKHPDYRKIIDMEIETNNVACQDVKQ